MKLDLDFRLMYFGRKRLRHEERMMPPIRATERRQPLQATSTRHQRCAETVRMLHEKHMVRRNHDDAPRVLFGIPFHEWKIMRILFRHAMLMREKIVRLEQMAQKRTRILMKELRQPV